MAKEVRRLLQNFIDHPVDEIEFHVVQEGTLVKNPEYLEGLLAGASPHWVGIAPHYSSTGTLVALAVCSGSRVIAIQFTKKPGAVRTETGRQKLQERVLANPDCIILSFDMAPLAAVLWLQLECRVLNGVDIQDVCKVKGNRSPLAAVQQAVGDRYPVFEPNINSAFNDKSEWDSRRCIPLALRAWLASWLPTLSEMEEKFRGAPRVNTVKQSEADLNRLAQLANTEQRRDNVRASSTNHEFTTMNARQNNVQVKSGRYQNRVQNTGNIRLVVEDEHGAKYVQDGRTGDVEGRSANIKSTSTLEGKTILSITTVERDRPTLADSKRNQLILRNFQGKAKISDSPFVKYILYPSDDFKWPEHFPELPTPALVSDRPMNDSQVQAAEQMLSHNNDSRIVLIKGPPGTGKTTVIAAFTQSAVLAGHKGIWLLAQSNVAVKNIAEKLVDIGFENWRLLVSSDFHYDWHEHLYYKIAAKTVQSDQFTSAAKDLNDCEVVLCTISMLSHPRIKLFTSRVPLCTLVIDEASQIAINDYISPLNSFSTIHKLCFIGDDKQLPPFGQEDNPDIKSIFEIEHIHSSILLLDTQYRMPPQIGDFISDAIYDGQLLSNPEHPVTDATCACYFVDVEGTETVQEKSYINEKECKAVCLIAAKLESEHKSYRIITPYDAQRNALENSLKLYALTWQNKCFNVDSFQGNEDDYIIISLVRSKKLGFLKNLRRTNVMLSRCKSGMYICSSWDFLHGIGRGSLVGRMAAAAQDEAWIDMPHLEAGNF